MLTVDKCNNRCLIVLIFILKILSCQSEKKSCKTEYNFYNKTPIIKWETKGNINHQIIVSKPPCLDRNNNLVTRICSNSKWYPSEIPKCEKIQKCPDPFTSIQDQCVVVKKPEKWDGNGCKLPIETSEIVSIDKPLNPELWLPVKRSRRYGPFEYTGFEDKYGEIFDDYQFFIADNRTFFENDCLLYNSETGKVQAENCSKLHQRICSFDWKFQFYYCPENCKSGGFGVAKCFCKIKNGKCEEYAEINSGFDRKLLGKIADDNTCQIANVTQFSEGYKSFINEENWFYSNSSTNCAICQRKINQIGKTELILSFEEKLSELYLLVYSPENLLMTKKNLALFCFTDASDLLKKKIKIELIFESNYYEQFLENSLLVYKLKLEKFMGNYWCEGFDLNLNLIHSQKIIAYKKKKGNEYSLRLFIKEICKNCGNRTNLLYRNFIDKSLKKIFKALDSEIRVMEIFDLIENTADILFHISTGKNRSIIEEFSEFQSKLLTELPDYINLIYFKSSEYCFPGKTLVKNRELNWGLTKLGKIAIPEELCLGENNIPVTRACVGDFLYGGKWSEIRGFCSENPTLSNYTNFLHRNILNISNFVEENLEEIANITENLTILDIYYLRKIFDFLNDFGVVPNLINFLKIINELIKVDRTILTESKTLFNGTDEILNLIEDIFSTPLNFEENSFYLFRNDNVIVHITNPFISNITGILLYGSDNKSLRNFTIKNYQRQDFPDLKNLQLGIYLSESVLNEISEHFYNETSNIKVITTIFVNDSLFVSNKYRTVSNVININIPGFGSYLKNPISMIFRSEEIVEDCGFWDYGRKTGRKPGEWSTLGKIYLKQLDSDNLYNCSFQHLTHFALLLMSRNDLIDETELIFSNPEENHDFILNIITIIGGSLSLFGISGIFMTAIIFDEWRQKIGTKLLLNLSLSILMENLSIHLSEIEAIALSGNSCKIVGIFLHYVILSKFSWMLTCAFLQYLRFIKVIGFDLNRIILKSVILGWGLPIIPVAITGFASTDNYTSTIYQLCYPKGFGFYLGILLPILLIILANLFIFCLIMFKISRKSGIKNQTNSTKLRFYLGILLFFMLGLPWIFGILAEIISYRNLKIVLFYIFCITATLQGFIMFLFYVVLNKEMKTKWMKYIYKIVKK